MSTFNEIEITTPYGDTDNVLELNIDSSSDAYVLQDVIKLSSTYTFSIWYRTESDSQITFNVLGESEIVDSTTSWNKFVKTVTVETLDETNIYIMPSVGVNSYFYEGYLVEGITDTSWTPAPEDVEQSITNVSSQYTQLADKFNWIVKSGTSSSDFTITDRMISLTSSALNIDALTTFKNSAENGTSTVINGGAIKANTITTSKLATDAIKSINYSYSSGNFSSAGTFLDLSTGLVRSKNFAIDSSGNAYFKGNIQANAGYIGGTSGWAITTNTITGNANSKIISGILESSNYVENSTGVQVNLNTGIIKGNIEASTLAAKEAIKIYVGSTKRNVITGHLANDFFYVRIGCDLSTSDIARVKPSIILNKSTASTNVSDMITINTSALDIEANTSIVGSLSASDISTYTNGGAWISGKRSAAINILTSQSEGAFHPVLRIQSYSGNVWCLGGFGDTVGIYGYYSGRTANGYDWCTTWDTSNGRMYVNSLNVGGFLFGQIIELSATTPYIDFHYDNSTADYTSRIIAVGSGILDIDQSGQWGGIRIDSTTGHLSPLGNGNYSLGSQSNRFGTLYTINGVNNSSLVELKTQINPFTSALEEIDKTDVFNYKLKANIKHNGDDIVHTGFVIGKGYNCSDYLISESRDGIDLYSAIGVTFYRIKELYEIVKKQQKTIEELKEKLNK